MGAAPVIPLAIPAEPPASEPQTRPRAPTRRKARYPGQLGKRIRHDELAGLTPAAVGAEMGRRFEWLFAHFKIDTTSPDRWMQATAALAARHVPAFQVGGRPGRPRGTVKRNVPAGLEWLDAEIVSTAHEFELARSAALRVILKWVADDPGFAAQFPPSLRSPHGRPLSAVRLRNLLHDHKAPGWTGMTMRIMRRGLKPQG